MVSLGDPEVGVGNTPTGVSGSELPVGASGFTGVAVAGASLFTIVQRASLIDALQVPVEVYP